MVSPVPICIERVLLGMLIMDNMLASHDRPTTAAYGASHGEAHPSLH